MVPIGLRAGATAAALLAAGLPIFLFLYGHLLDRSLRRVRSSVLPTALLALALATLHAIVEPARLAGAWSGVIDPSLHALLLSSDFGTTTAIRAFGLILIAGSARWAGRLGTGVSVIGAALVAISFALMGHTASDPQRWLLAPLLLIHLLAIAFWLGALWPLLNVIRLETEATAASVINRFSRTALCVVPLVLLAGLAMGGLLLTSLSGLRTPYGVSLVTKFAGFTVLMALAALNKWRLTPGVAQGNQFSVLAFRMSVLAEGVLILAVITVTAVMTSLFSPGH